MSVPSRISALVLVAAALAVPASAEAADPATAAVTGHVHLPGGQAVAGIEVDAWSYLDGAWSIGYSGYSGTDGAYTMPPLPPDTYRIEFRDYDGLHTHSWYDGAGGAATIDTATDVTVSGGESRTIDGVVAPAGAVSGTVRDAAGQPVADDVVDVFQQVGGTWTQVAGATTGGGDLAGEWLVGELAAGTYRIRFEGTNALTGEWWHDATSLATATGVGVAVGATTTGVDPVLSPRARLTGRVTNGAGQGVSGVTASVYQLVGGTWKVTSTAPTSSAGVFTSAPLAAGTYRLCYGAPFPYATECWNGAADVAHATGLTVPATGNVVANAVLAYSRTVVNTKKPTVTGTARVGRVLGATAGTWSPTSVKLSYQWRADGAPIARATGRTYKLVGAQRGRRISCAVTATAAQYRPRTVVTAATVKVVAAG